MNIEDPLTPELCQPTNRTDEPDKRKAMEKILQKQGGHKDADCWYEGP